MTGLRPLPCCAQAARDRGAEPSLEILCASCNDYRSFLKYTKYVEQAKAVPKPEDGPE